jgi:hypothetical protein
MSRIGKAPYHIASQSNFGGIERQCRKSKRS